MRDRAPHEFRETVATQMLASGTALEVVQPVLDHASLGTTFDLPVPGKVAFEARGGHVSRPIHAVRARVISDGYICRAQATAVYTDENLILLRQ